MTERDESWQAMWRKPFDDSAHYATGHLVEASVAAPTTVRFLQGDCREVLRTLPDESVHCVVTATNMAYLAGLVDGEGYIGIKKSQRKDAAAPSYHARIQVRMVDEAAIAFLAQECGGRYYLERPEAGKRRALYCWQASDALAEHVLRCLLPYLRIKRRNAEAVLRFREWQAGGRTHRTKVLGRRQFQGFRGGLRTVRTMGFSDEYVAACERAYLECKRLNRGVIPSTAGETAL